MICLINKPIDDDMRIRQSDMPYEDIWEKFFDAELILSKLDFNNSINNAAEFGAGYGTFSIPASKIIRGTLYAFDIDEQLIEITNRKVEENKIDNIKVIRRDIISEGTGLKMNQSIM